MQRQNFNNKRTRSRVLVVPILGVLTGATAVLPTLTRRWYTLPWSPSDPCRKFTWKTLRHRHSLTKGQKQLSDVLDSFHWNDEYTVYEALSHIISWICSFPPLNLRCLSYSSQFFLLFFPFSEGWSGLTQTYNRNRSWTPFDPNTGAPFALLHSFPNISFHQIILKVRATAKEGGLRQKDGISFLASDAPPPPTPGDSGLALRLGEKEGSWAVMQDNPHDSLANSTESSCPKVEWLGLYPLPPWPLDVGCRRKGMLLGEAALQLWQTLQGPSWRLSANSTPSVAGKRVGARRQSCLGSQVSPWDSREVWVLGFVQERIQEWAIVKWKKIYSGRYTTHRQSVDHLRRWEAPGYGVSSF